MAKFIKWTAHDCEYVGQYVSTKDARITMILSDGVLISFPEDDGVIVEVKKPKDWSEDINTPVDEPVKTTRQPKKGSKKEKALIIVQDVYGKGHGKEATIQRIVDVLGMSPAGAQTYFYNAKRELAL